MRLSLLSLFSLIFSIAGIHTLQAQYQITGTVNIDEGKQPAAFASVILMDAQDSTQINGVLTDAKGKYQLDCEAGNYVVMVSFLGHEVMVSEAIVMNEANPLQKLSDMTLKERDATLDEVQITSNKSYMQMSMDKRIFNVGQDLSNAGASAQEILGNIPSVTVDGEGTVRLRGSSDVRILVDGRPSGLVRGNGLQQLQGSLIESIEVVTNPSARYEAEGKGGVINIVLKKDKKQGFNGSFDIITGEPANYGVVANVNYRVKKFNFFINYGITYRKLPNIRSLYQENYSGDTTFIQLQGGEGEKEGLDNNIRGGLDYYFNDNNILTAYYRWQRSDATRITDLTYEDFLFNRNNLTGTSLRNQTEKEKEPYSEYAIAYKKLFGKEGHELNADFRYLNYWEYSDQDFSTISFLPGETPEQGEKVLQNSINDEYENQYLIQVDYVQPFAKEGKFEAGLRSSFRDMTNDFIATQQNDQGVWEVLNDFDNIFVYVENIHAAYGIIGNEGDKISYQAGLRAEITDVTTRLEETNEENPRDYTNLFPSGNLTFHFPGSNDIQLSYSRRVRRPVYRELSPFVTLADERNFFSGNPDLDPEFTHSLELAYLKFFEKGSISSALYYRDSEATIQSIIRVDEVGNSTRLPENLNGQESYGADLSFSYLLFPWWKLDASFNFFRAITDGTNIGQSFESDTYSWFIRQTSKFTLPGQWDVQLRGNYEAPEQIPQGEREAIWSLDLAIKKELWNNKGSITLNATDIFNTRINRSIIRGEDFFRDSESQFLRRQVNLTLSYRFNQ